MTKRQIAEALELILAPHALSAEVEYELEDLGLVVIDHRPYAHLTQAGVAFLAEQKFNEPMTTTTSAVCSLGHHDLCEYGDDAKTCKCICHEYRMLKTAEEVDAFISDDLLNSALDWFEGEPKMGTEDFLDRLFPKYGDIYDTDGRKLDLDSLDNPAARRIMSRARKLRKERDQ